MKKIPTLFERIYEGKKVVGIKDQVKEGLEWVLAGEGDATIKIDGSCCAIVNGVFYKRYDAKKGKMPPNGAIPCCDPDPVTGHWPHWVKVDWDNPADKWFVEAFRNTFQSVDGVAKAYKNVTVTFEAIGPHFQGNPYNYDLDILEPHGALIIQNLDRSFEGIRDFLNNHLIEGIVFWKDGEPQCKIKRTDFGFEWPVKNEGEQK